MENHFHFRKKWNFISDCHSVAFASFRSIREKIDLKQEEILETEVDSVGN